jgi:hypothetical protein
MAIKLGTENKNKTYAALGLGIVAILYLIYFIHDNFFSTPTPAPVTVAAPARTAPPSTRTPAGSATTPTQTASGVAAAPFAHQAIELPRSSALDPTLHPEIMAQAEETTYAGTGRNIFSMDSTPPPTPAQIERAKFPVRPGPPPPPPGPPPPPNIDLKFYGYSAAKDGARQAFLLHGDDIFIAKEGDVVDRRYKVMKISAFSVDVQDLPYSHTQTLPLTQN